MQIIFLTIFPEIFKSFLETSLVQKAIAKGLLSAQCINLRDFADPPHFNVDDIPYGGGAGMVMKPDPLVKAIRAARALLPNALVVAPTPAATRFTQSVAQELSSRDLIFLCGRYEGIDQRVLDSEVDRTLSLGDYVVMGGEVPSMMIVEAALRLVPGVIGNADSAVTESFAFENELLEAPQYTRPPVFEGKAVPEVLLSGNHQKISEWRKVESQKITAKVRPDLLKVQK